MNDFVLICAFVEMQHEVGQKKQSELMDRILIERNWQNITTYQFKTMGKTLSKAKENLMLIFPKGFEQTQSKCNNHGNNCTTFALTIGNFVF